MCEMHFKNENRTAREREREKEGSTVYIYKKNIRKEENMK